MSDIFFFGNAKDWRKFTILAILLVIFLSISVGVVSFGIGHGKGYKNGYSAGAAETLKQIKSGSE